MSFSMAILEAVTSVGAGELCATRFHAVVVGLQVVGEGPGEPLRLLEERLLISFRCGIVVECELHFRAVRFLWRCDGEPAVEVLAEVGFLHKAALLYRSAEPFPDDVEGGGFDFVIALRCGLE